MAGEEETVEIFPCDFTDEEKHLAVSQYLRSFREVLDVVLEGV